MIVYVLTHNEANEGGTVEGVYSTDQKARDAIPSRGLPTGDDSIFFWEVLPFEVDKPPDRLEPVKLD